jgi:hypothetical protein
MFTFRAARPKYRDFSFVVSNGIPVQKNGNYNEFADQPVVVKSELLPVDTTTFKSRYRPPHQMLA